MTGVNNKVDKKYISKNKKRLFDSKKFMIKEVEAPALQNQIRRSSTIPVKINTKVMLSKNTLLFGSHLNMEKIL